MKIALLAALVLAAPSITDLSAAAHPEAAKADDVKPKQIQITAGASEPVTVTPTSGNGSESK